MLTILMNQTYSACRHAVTTTAHNHGHKTSCILCHSPGLILAYVTHLEENSKYQSLMRCHQEETFHYNNPTHERKYRFFSDPNELTYDPVTISSHEINQEWLLNVLLRIQRIDPSWPSLQKRIHSQQLHKEWRI